MIERLDPNQPWTSAYLAVKISDIIADHNNLTIQTGNVVKQLEAQIASLKEQINEPVVAESLKRYREANDYPLDAFNGNSTADLDMRDKSPAKRSSKKIEAEIAHGFTYQGPDYYLLSLGIKIKTVEEAKALRKRIEAMLKGSE